MLYTLEQGAIEQNIIKQCLLDKRPLPERISNAPQLFFGLELYYNAFLDLTTCRQINSVEGPITWAHINEYCDRLALSSEQREDMLYYIRVMDNAYLEWRSKQAKGTNHG